MLLTTIGAQAQGTAFTYQGRLQDGTNHASGCYDLTFSVWTAATGPAQIGGSVTNLATGVTNGLFAVSLDFGNGVFDGNPRWLEIGVRANGGEMFTKLSPRQPLAATPYAIFAGGVNAAGISGPIPAGSIGTGMITSNMLAPGAAAASLAASGQGGVPSGGVVFSASDNDTNLKAAGYMRTGGFVNEQNQWRELASSPALGARQGQATVWTGSKMIVWGGHYGNDNPDNPPPKIRYTDGGAYNPTANTWAPIATNAAPTGREDLSWVWTGIEMIVWGGYFYDGSYHYFNDGARYNPISNRWTAVTTNDAPTARRYHTVVWTGTEMIVWGGMSSDSSGFSNNTFNDGWRFNPASNTWFPVTMSSAPAARCLHTAVWTGTEMIVWGGLSGSGLNIWMGDGGRYNPITDTWSAISATNTVGQRSRHTAVWTGKEMIVWGGFSGGGSYLETGGRYNPSTDTWAATDCNHAPSGRQSHSVLWTGREMVVWGGKSVEVMHRNDGGCYDPSSNTWLPLTIAPRAPAGRMGHSAVWTGSEMVIFGGRDYIWYGDLWSCTPPKALYLYLRQ